MSDEKEQTTFDLTCHDGTVFTLPSKHPEINIGGIGGVPYNAIMEDPAAIPPQFDQFCTHRPPRLSRFMKIRIWIADRLSEWINSRRF